MFRTRRTVWRGWMVRLQVPPALGGTGREARGAISDVVRGLIDDAYEGIVQERRRHAVDRLIGLEAEDPPDADSLARELEAAHEPGGLH